MATLGISMNTRLVGIAIINQNGLADYSIRLHKSSWSQAKATKIITSLEPCVRRYCIKKVVLSIPYAYHQTNAYKALQAQLCEYFESQKIRVCTESAEALYSFCPQGEKKTKKAMMRAITERFPILNYYHYKETRNKTKYYLKLFEAVTVAALHH